MKREQLEQLSKDDLIDLVLMLQSQLDSLKEELSALKMTISQTSKTSSKPPSSDQKANRPSRSSKWGGRKGHKGHSFKRIQEVDEIFVVNLEHCIRCKSDLSTQAVLSHKVHQRIAIEIHRKVTDYACEKKYCPHCQLNVTAPLPDGISHTHYDGSISSLVNYLNKYHHIPQDRLREILHDLANIPISKGSLNKMLTLSCNGLKQFYEHLKDRIANSNVLGADETGYRVTLKNFWLWVVQNKKFSYFHFDARRSSKVMIQLIGKKLFKGILVSDFFSAYSPLECQKQKCNAHLFRELKHVLKCEPQAGSFIEAIFKLLVDAKNFKEGNPHFNPEKFANSIEDFKNRLQALVDQSLPSDYKQALRIQKRLRKHKHEILTFLEVYEVPFDNNASERAIRVAVIHRKVSQCFRTLHSANNFARWLSFIQTLRKQNIPIFPAIVDIGNGIIPKLELD